MKKYIIITIIILILTAITAAFFVLKKSPGSSANISPTPTVSSKPLTTQEIIANTLSKYQENEKNASDESEQYVVMKNGVVIDKKIDYDGLFFMASSSKVFLVNEIGNVVKKKNISVKDKFLAVGYDSLVEVVDLGLLKYLPLEDRNLPAELGFDEETTKKFNEYLKGSQMNIIDFQRLIASIRQKLNDKNKTIQISFNELCNMALRVSTNKALQKAKNYAIDYYTKTSPKYVETLSEREKYELGFDTLNQNIQSVAKSVEITKSFDDNDLWLQKGSNTGEIQDVITAYDEIIKKGLTSDDPFVKKIISAIENNDIDFKFDVTNLMRAKDKLGDFKVYEKTGLYSSVFWPQNLAQKGYPVHVLVASLSSIVNKNDRYTIAIVKTFKTDLPANGKTGLPDEDASEYQKKYGEKKEGYFTKFNETSTQLLKKYIGI